ncbi:transcription factor WhiB [Mycobacteroides abscessus subsp. abscessus]|uniref:WhiB family transcriptional regulator n=1 Tax=Mycobacteroides abscessus TaxID=36809 RepID=UPI00092623FD|nr:WhiB family transcriptional regulator [Mycobacteroides abscessus]SHS18261.1 transcription factor WhiB [Mycobacteroides abscessus subsp. abscessus]
MSHTEPGKPENKWAIARRIAARQPTPALMKRLQDRPQPTRELRWQERGLCRQTDPGLFFPLLGEGVQAAKKICAGCEVKDTCLEYALQHDEGYGVWGGCSASEREQIKQSRQLGGAA